MGCSTACPDQSKKTKNTLMKIMKIDWGSVEIEIDNHILSISGEAMLVKQQCELSDICFIKTFSIGEINDQDGIPRNRTTRKYKAELPSAWHGVLINNIIN